MRSNMIITLYYLLILTEIAVGSPNASELLQKFAETQDELKSVIIKSEDSIEINLPRPEHKFYHSNEFRLDGNGNRANLRTYTWGILQPGEDFLQRDEAAYNSYLCDSKQFVNYSTDTDPDLGRCIITRDKTRYNNQLKTMLPRAVDGHEAIGYFYGDDERMDTVLRKADTISVRDKTERIGDSDCYVINAMTKCGEYTVWIDPQHGYNIAKATQQRKEGDIFNNNPLPKGQYTFSSLSNVRFEKINGVWIPMECDIEAAGNLGEGIIFKQMTHHKKTEVVLNPDHDKLGSFIQDDIKNGALVLIVGVDGITYKWQDGEPIPNVDKEVISEIDKMAKDALADAKKKDDPNKAKAAIASATAETVKGILEKYAANQDKFTSFIAKADTSIDLSGTSQTEKSEFRTDGSKVNHRSTITGKSSSKETSEYSSFLWDGQSLIQYKIGMVLLSKLASSKKRLVTTEYKGAPLLGICGGDYDRLDKIISDATNATLKPATETVGNSQCYLIEAKTTSGSYKVCFDPQHGYNIARVDIQRSVKTGVTAFSMQDVKFERINNIWVPMEADIQQTENAKSVKWHHNRTQVLLNPDHDKLKSFVADDIPNGTKVSMSGDSTANYIWQDGKAVPAGR
jgi:hypothetical protein